MPGPRFSRVVDLSHPLAPGMPHWPGDPATRFEPWADLDGHGFALRRLCLGEHAGTHVNAPAHLIPGGRTIDSYEARELALPVIVLDMRAKAKADPDAALEPYDVAAWERAHGPVPAGCLAAACTGWDAKWSDPRAFLGLDAGGNMHFPGFSAEAAALLLRERGAKALGIDTHGLDPGLDQEFGANMEVAGAGCLALECLANLGGLPPLGALAVIGALRAVGGGGAPARVTALVP